MFMFIRESTSSLLLPNRERHSLRVVLRLSQCKLLTVMLESTFETAPNGLLVTSLSGGGGDVDN